VRDVFVHPSGQDDNLGDSALRAASLGALQGAGVRLHVFLEEQSSDYVSGLPLSARDALYSNRPSWLRASEDVEKPIYVVNAGEINPRGGRAYPNAKRVREMSGIVKGGGVILATGLGLKNPAQAASVSFSPLLREAAVMSWRDSVSRDAAGFGEVAPDWAFALGSSPSRWRPYGERRLIAVTLRFDRPWPGADWIDAVKDFAYQRVAEVVTVAQVSRDAPRAVQLARALGGRYLVAPSTRHTDLESHVRSVYARALAVISDRAHALIMGATEGAYPLGTASDPQKIKRLLDAAGIGALTGEHATLAERAAYLGRERPILDDRVEASRRELRALTERIRDVVMGRTTSRLENLAVSVP